MDLMFDILVMILFLYVFIGIFVYGISWLSIIIMKIKEIKDEQ